MCFHCPKVQLNEKEMVRMEIQALLDQFYTKQSQSGNNNGLSLFAESFSPKIHQIICF